MSPVDAYLADLRAALGDRLPPAVHTARLREVRIHLLESAQDVGEAEAVRRYGGARAAANGLVRSHRGYDARSPWMLALPVAAGFVLTNLLARVLVSRDVVATSRLYDDLGLATMVLSAVAFARRAAETRRWIAGPMATIHAVAVISVVALGSAASGSPWRADQFALLALYVALFTAVWYAINALALGAGSLLDLRRVRRAGGTR